MGYKSRVNEADPLEDEDQEEQAGLIRAVGDLSKKLEIITNNIDRNNESKKGIKDDIERLKKALKEKMSVKEVE